MLDSNLGLSDDRILFATMPGSQHSMAFGCNPLGKCASACEVYVWFIPKINNKHRCLTDLGNGKRMKVKERARMTGRERKEGITETHQNLFQVRLSSTLFFLIIKVIMCGRNKLFNGPDRVWHCSYIPLDMNKELPNWKQEK